MTRPKKRPTPVGMGRASLSLGRADARATHRNAQAAQSSEQLYGDGLTVDDKTGQIKVAPMRSVPMLSTGATLGDVITKLNQLILEAQKAKHMEGR